MPEMADLAADLQRLLRLIMQETDPDRYDELARKIWLILDERERLRNSSTDSSNCAH